MTMLVKFKYLWLFIPLMLTAACDREESVPAEIELTGSSACKSHGLKSFSDHSSDQDCIQYLWVSGDTLKVKHVNAGFNCCPQGFAVKLAVAGDTLVITESENSSLCDCSCLFDLNYNLTGISKGNWWIRIVEPYVQDQLDNRLLFKVDLKKTREGEFCLTRTGYPWGL
jgi:hypothetical protein